MNETRAILDAYARARAHGTACALATVTFVAGSSYRRVGARMLIADDGNWVGCVSGGCLERDLLRKAAWAMECGQPSLVTYDTREDGDGVRTPGAGLGCNGVIEILLEPVPAGGSHAVLELLQRCSTERISGGMILFPHDPALPAIIWEDDAAPTLPMGLPPELRSDLERCWTSARDRGQALGLDCISGAMPQRIFVEVLRPAVQVAVIGAGYDAVAMAALGVHLGYEVNVVDFRSAVPIPRRAFAGIARYIQCTPADLPAQLVLDERSVVIVMTHQAQDDLAVLPYVLDSRPAYIGLLGPRKRARRLLAECDCEEALGQANLHAPLGLDLGGGTPAEIALAAFAEIQATLSGRAGGALRDLPGPIHARESA